MGLLDDLLGQLAGGPAASPRRTSAPETEAGGGMGRILAALLPVVLMMLRNRGGGSPSADVGRNDGGGGLGDLLGSILGGGAGGLGALLEQLQRAGFGDQARSWIGAGENQALPPGALEQIFGQGGLAEIARRAGLTQDEASRGLAELMPAVVDRVTPRGEVPGDDDLLASVEDLARRLGV